MRIGTRLLVFGVLPLMPLRVSAQEGEPVIPIEVTYIANAGFLIAVGEEKVLVDALQSNRFGFASTPAVVLERMNAGRRPFEGIDLMIVSHAHADHFNADMVCGFLAARTEVNFVSSPEVVGDLADSPCRESPQVLERIREVNPEWGSMAEVLLPGIRARFLPLNHEPPGRERYLTLGSLLEIGGRKILHLADMDSESTLPLLREYGLAAEEIDVVFLDHLLPTDAAGASFLRDEIRAKHMVIMHVREDRFEEEKAQVEDVFPEAVFFNFSLERRVFR